MSLLRGLRRASVVEPTKPEAIAEPIAPPPLHPKLAANMEILGNGYGQLGTFETHRPLDPSGNALPWFTYPAIEYLKRIDCGGWRVFEYGAGQSTIYWSDKGAHVTSVEHNEEWFSEMKQRQLPNSDIVHRSDKDSYVNAIKDRGLFDVIVIDGVWREACADGFEQHLTETGFLILDNSDWYHEAGAKIRSKGFLEVGFSGFGPVNDYTWTTSLFFRSPSASKMVMTSPDPIGGIVLGPEHVTDMW